jgi:uncharacterized protein (DUF2225 family)
MTGGGRLIAGVLTDELRRMYEPSAKFGEIVPLVYTMNVCPKCYYASFPQDFCILDKESLNRIYERMQERYESVKRLFSKFNFAQARTLNEGAASYYLASSATTTSTRNSRRRSSRRYARFARLGSSATLGGGSPRRTTATSPTSSTKRRCSSIGARSSSRPRGRR